MDRVELSILYTDGNTTGTRVVVNKWKFQDAMMGEQYITFNITSEKPIAWAVGDYCIFRGETFTLNYIPSVTQKARTGDRQDAYTYENVKFESRREELTRVIMLDITPTTGEYIPALGTNYTGSSKFQLFCGETSAVVSGVLKTFTAVCALAAKIQANLDRFFGADVWHIYVDTTSTYTNASGQTVLVTHTEDKVMTFDNTTVAKALSEVHNTFDLNYSVSGRDIYIGYSLSNLTSETVENTFDFGYGKGYPTPLDSGKALFQIKRIANPQQKIVTRLRALGSTKNIPYRYYNKKYDLSQSLFPTNLQLPDTFEIPSVKESHNATRDSVYGVNPITNLPYLRHVKGETNDAYIDKNDDAENSTEGIREDCARWDGSNSDLPEIYPTIEEATYGELRGASVEDQDGNTGSGSFPGYDNDERVDELLAIGYMNNGVMVDDANQGGGILPESGTTGTGVPRSAVISQKSLNYNSVNYGDFTYNTGSHSANYLSGPEQTLFTVQNVTPGRYAIVPTGPSYDSVKYVFNISSQQSGISAYVGFMIIIRQTTKSTGNTKTIATYFSDFTSLSRGETKEATLPEIPDVKEGSSAKVLDVTVTDTSDISVMFVPLMRSVTVPSGFTDNFAFVYHVGKSSSDTTYPYEPEYTWKSLDDDGSVEDIFHVFVKDMGFDFEACFTGDTPTMVMKSGHCVGREFEIGENVEKVTYNGKKGYMLTLHRATDSSLNTYYPSAVDTIEAGDIFVLLNISMPDAYVKMAEVRLLRAATDYLADNCETQFTYQPSIDDIYLRRNYDNMVAEGTPELSIFWRLYAGLKFTFRGIPAHEDDPLPLAELTIEQVSISMGEGLTPKVEMVLNDEVQQTTLQKLTISVDRIYNTLNGGGGSSGDSYAMLISLLNSEGGKRFLSKTKNDTANGLIKFVAGLQTGDFSHNSTGASIDQNGHAELDTATIRRVIESLDFVKGQLGGSGWGIYNNQMGKSTLEVDNLIVRMKAIFAELEIRKLSYLGGDYIFSAAGSKICKVQYIGHDSQGHEIVLNQTQLIPLTDSDGNFLMQRGEPVVWEKEIDIDPEDIDAFRCYMYSDDGTTATMNWWDVDDQARCQTFNVKERGTVDTASNRYYWRRVTGVGSSILEDGREYNYIDLSVTDCSLHDDPELEDDWPLPNDTVVQLGNRDSEHKASRQNAIELIVEGDDAPAIIEYAGIHDYQLASYRRTKISPKGDEFVAKSFSIITSNGTVPIPRDRGEWDENETYYYYDRVSWDGALWLCYTGNPSGVVNSEPAEGNDDWLLQVAGGQQGAAGQSAPTMVCTPNPVMVETDKNKIATGSWSADIKIMAYYNGNRVNILSNPAITITKDGTWTTDTPTIDENGIGHIVAHGNSGSAVPNGTINITAYIANPTGGNNIPVHGTVSISPTMRGDDGESVAQVVMNPEVVWLPTNSSSYLPHNYEGYVTINIADASGMYAQEPLSILFDGQQEYSIIYNQTKVVRVFLDDISHEDISVGLEWAMSYMVQSLDIPLTITYILEQGAEQKVVHAVLSIRAAKQGAKGTDGENAISLQYSPSVMMFDVDSDYLALDDYHLSVEVRAYSGSERIALIDGLRDLYSNDENIDDALNYTIENETIGGKQYQYVIITCDIIEGYTYDLPNPYVYFTLIDGDDGYFIDGGFPVMRNISGTPGSNGTNGRGISSMDIAYGTSSSATQQPSSWVPSMPPVSQGQYLWSRTTFHFTDGTPDQVLYSVIYQAEDGENGTSVSIKGSALGHVGHISDIPQQSAQGLWLVDENGASPTSIAIVYDTSTTPPTSIVPDAGDGYIIESTGHLWVYSDSGWIDAGRIKGDDGRPSYIHYAWANSEDGSDDFTTTKEIGENYLYMGICVDNNPDDPGNDYDWDYDYDDDDPDGHPWTFYEWNLIKGADGNKGTTVLGEAVAYLNDQNAGGYTFQSDGIYLADLANYALDASGNLVRVTDGTGMGHKVIIKSGNTKTTPDPVEGDAYTISGELYTSADFHWVNLGQWSGRNAFIHYAWADDVSENETTHEITVTGFTTTKLATQDKPWIGVLADNVESDSQIPTDYKWTLIKGNGIAESKIFYAKSQNGVNPPNDGWTENLSSLLPVESLYYLWTKTVLTFDQGEQVSYSVAYSGYEGRDGRSVVILGTWPELPLPLPNEQGKIPLIPNGEYTHDLEISEGFVIEDDGHLYVWLGGDQGWQDVGKFNGEDGRTTYLHIAWANSIGYNQYGMVSEVQDFTVEKPEGVDYFYMGVCSDFNEQDPSPNPDWQPTDPEYLDIVNRYTWNKIKGAEGSNGTKVRCRIVKHVTALSTADTEEGWYAVDNTNVYPASSSPYHVSDPTPCLRKRTSAGGWPSNEVDDDPIGAANWKPFYEKEGRYYPDEGEAFIDQNGVLWSYIEAKWVNLGQYVGDNAYLHLAWANSVKYDSQGNLTECEGFTTAKTTTQDYRYVGFCSDNNYNDPQTPSAYTWQRLRGMAQPMIVTDSDQVIADADADGKITSLNDVTGLPTTISLVVDGKTIGMGSWKTEQCKITMVYSDGTQVPINIVGNYPTQKPGIRLGQLTFGTSLTVAWTYAQDSGADPVLPLRQIRLHIVATDSDFNFTVDKTIPVIVNRKGNGSDFAVQYAQTKNGSWHNTFQDGDKWMRIYQNGAWGSAIKIVASDMNVRGEAYFHFASVQDKPQDVGIGELCLVDLDGSTYSALVTFESQSSKTVVAALQGECYILRNDDDPKNGHLFIATDTGWQDIGQITGADGTNAVAIALNPASIILNQNDDGTLDSFTTQVIVVDGSTPTTDFTIGQPDTSRPQDWHTASAVVNNQTKVVTMTAANDPNGVPYDNGLVDIPVTYKGSTWLLRFNWYANLLGTWKQTIIGDVNQSIADLRIYAEDETGNIIVTTSRGTYTLSATLLSNVLEEYAANAEDNPDGYGIMSRSMVEQTARGIVATVEREVDGIQTDVFQLQTTADQIQTTVSNLKTDTENLFSFAETHLTNGSYGVSGIVPFIQGYGVECKSVSNRITGFGLKGQGGSFVLTCEMRMQQQGIVTVSASLMNTNPVGGGNFNLNNTWERKVFVFKDIPDSRTLTNNYDGYLDFTCQSITTSNRLYIRNLMLSRGDCKPNVFIVSSKDMMDNLPGDVLSFSKHQNVQLQSDRYKGYPVYKLHFVNGDTEQTDMLFANDVYLRQNQCYSLSFWARSTKDCHIACFMHGTGDTVEGTITPTLVVSPTPTLASGEMSVGNAVDGVTYIRLTTGYKRYTVHWWTSSPNARSIILGRVQSSFTTQLTTDVYITGVEFREGYWTEDKLNSQSMIRQTATEIEMKVNETGINIEDGTITLDAGKTRIIGDMELHDEEQGFVIYDQDNVERVSMKSESLGDYSESGFGVRVIGEGDALSIKPVGGTAKATFDTISLGNVSSGEAVNISAIVVSINVGRVLSAPRYEYVVRCNGQKMGNTQSGTAVPRHSYGGDYMVEGVSGTAESTGELTIDLIIYGTEDVSFHASVYLSTTKVGLNKIGSDGAVFANDATHFNWFGRDKTIIANTGGKLEVNTDDMSMKSGNVTFKVDSRGIWGKDTNYSNFFDIGSRVKPATISTSTYTANLEVGLLFATAATTITLPNPNTCPGKVYYVKGLTNNVKVTCAQTNRFVFQNSSSLYTNYAVDTNATILVSTGDYWLVFSCQ